MNRLLITGGAGFVGSNLALLFREKYPKLKISVLDNLKRRGSELNLKKFKEQSIDFFHGDIRTPADFEQLGSGYDLFIEASAEPSVLTGMQGDSPMYAIETNLFGTVNALEFARKHSKKFLFLSTSRVYSIPALSEIALKEADSRFVLSGKKMNGLTEQGITEEFSLQGFRSIYGSTKLASELLIEEYAHAYKLDAVINRCGVIVGPGQFGKVDQGVFTLWVANHYFGKPLKYTGFGGKGFQVRDLLHPQDLFTLIEKQMQTSNKAEIYNVGGGLDVSTSLFELTKICETVTGKKIEMGSQSSSATVDIPFYVTDNAKVSAKYNWQPKIRVKEIVVQINDWIKKNETELKGIFGS